MVHCLFFSSRYQNASPSYMGSLLTFGIARSVKMGTLSTGDPFDWTVDQVVSYLCETSPDAWSKSSAPTARPDPATFRRALEENDVNGEILLTEITKTTLHEDLGVKSLGQRTSIFKAVLQLRQQSAKYQQHLAASHPATHHSPQIPWPSHLSSRDSVSPVGSHFGYFDQSSNASPLVQNATSMRPPVLPGSTITPSPFRPADQSPRLDTPPDFSHVNNIGRKLPESGLRQAEKITPITSKDAPVDTPTQLANSTSQSRAARGEHYVTDGRGRKRRRLNLGPPVAAIATKNVIQKPYMRRTKVSATDIFYKPTSQEEDEDNFLLTKSDFPRGERLFVNKLMKHYFQQQPRYLGMNGRKKILGVIPHSRKFLQLGEKQYFTLFTPQDKKILVSKAEVDQWPQLTGDASLGDPMVYERPPPENDRHGRFLWKYAHGDDREASLPPLGESGSEGGYDTDTWKEMEEEKQMKAIASELRNRTEGRVRYLSASEVNATIDGCLDTFSKDWDSKKLPVENRKAWRLWMLSRKQKTRKQQIANAKKDVDRLQLRIDRLRERIHDEQWSKVTELQTQCQCMEPTVSDIKKEEWRMSVLELSSCPPKPLKETVPRKRTKKPVQLFPEDEESLGSDSEGGFDDNMEDFVLPDIDAEGTRDGDEMDIVPSLENDEQNQNDNSGALRSHSDSEDEIVGPVRRRRLRSSTSDDRRHVHSSPVAESTPQRLHERRGSRSSNQTQRVQEDVEIVDLTQADESPGERKTGDKRRESGDIRTPPLNPTISPEDNVDPSSRSEEKSSSRSSFSLDEKNEDPVSEMANPRLSKLPEFGDVLGISKLSCGFLQERQDRRRLLTRLITLLPDDDRDNLRTFLEKSPRSWFETEGKSALESLLVHKKRLPHLTEPENKAVLRVTALYVSWVVCKKFDRKGILKKYIRRAQDEYGEFNRFFKVLTAGFDGYYSQFDTSNNPEVVDISELDRDEDEVDVAAKSTPHKKRKRTVKQSREAIHTQKSGQHRVMVQQMQQTRLAKRMESMGMSNNDPERQAVSFENPVIYLDPHIGRRVKPHQLSGIQFMWREIMTDEKSTGCLLAHTMGLGKTMQV